MKVERELIKIMPKLCNSFSFNVKAKKKIARIMERERELTKGGGMVTELQIWRLQRFEIGGRGRGRG